MRNKSSLIALLLVASCYLNVSAQRSSATLNLGTQGVGAEYRYSPEPSYSVHGGVSILPFNTNFTFTTQSTPSEVDMKVNFQNVHALFDWHPFRNQYGYRDFLLSAGAGYFWKNGGTAVITSTETYKYGDISIPGSEAGQLNGKVSWKKIAPYFGIGFENPQPEKKFNLGFALGVYYLGQPNTNLTGTNLVSVNEANQAQFNQNLHNYRFLPVIQLNLNYSLD